MMHMQPADIMSAIKPFVKPFFIIFAIYSLSMLSIWRADYLFEDDMRRAITGEALGYGGFRRYSQTLLSYIMWTNFSLTDISPLPQIFAMKFLSISGVILVFVLYGKKISYLALVLSTLIGLSPFVLANWLYKFDAPAMALSILISIVPFLFWRSLREENRVKPWFLFGIFATVCILVMLTAYQASSGIYPVMVLALCLCDFLDRRKISRIIKTAVLFSLPYLLAGFLFGFVLFPEIDSYRNVEMHAISNMATGIIYNIRANLAFIYSSLNTLWSLLLLGIFICFALSVLILSKREGVKKLLDIGFALAFVFVSIPVSYGIFLLLEIPFVGPRSNMGIGFVLAIVGIIASKSIKTKACPPSKNPEPAKNISEVFTDPAKLRSFAGMILILPAVVMLYSSIVFSFALGNALSDQHRWNTFRAEILLADLSRLYPDREEVANSSIQLTGNIGLSAVANHVNDQYPITQHIIASTFGAHYFGSYMFRHYYNFDWERSYFRTMWDCGAWQIMENSYYHTIKDSGDGRVSVIIR